jgi:hypothetical protein
MELNAKSAHRLDAIKELTDAETRTAVLRQALKVYEWLVEEIIEKDQDLFIGKAEKIPSELTRVKVMP